MAVVWNIPIANNRASADFMISSPLMDSEYDRLVPDYENYAARKIDLGRRRIQTLCVWGRQTHLDSSGDVIDDAVYDIIKRGSNDPDTL